MSYYSERRKIVDKIYKELGILSITQLEDILTEVQNKKPLSLKEYIKENFGHDSFGCDEIFRQEEILQAFEHEIRAICLELGPKFKLVETTSEYIDHFSEMYVQGHELDIWIHEAGCVFNPCELAFVIYLLYTGEVVF